MTVSAALVLAMQAAAPAAADPPPITITQENVELNGAGTFTFVPDPAAFDVDPPEGGTGLSFTLRLWFDTAGNPGDCDAPSSPPDKAEQTACRQLIQSAHFHPLAGMVLPWRRGFVDVRFSFYLNPAPGITGGQMFAVPEPGYRNSPIDYPADDTAPADRLSREDGRFFMQIGPEDYPSIAQRYALESASAVQLGIAHDGSIKNCRPRQAPGIRTAFLDNYTCRLILQRGRFEMNAATPAYDGLRYYNTTLGWRLPE